jgi:hypothetical protein
MKKNWDEGGNWNGNWKTYTSVRWRGTKRDKDEKNKRRNESRNHERVNYTRIQGGCGVGMLVQS